MRCASRHQLCPLASESPAAGKKSPAMPKRLTALRRSSFQTNIIETSSRRLRAITCKSGLHFAWDEHGLARAHHNDLARELGTPSVRCQNRQVQKWEQR